RGKRVLLIDPPSLRGLSDGRRVVRRGRAAEQWPVGDELTQSGTPEPVVAVLAKRVVDAPLQDWQRQRIFHAQIVEAEADFHQALTMQLEKRLVREVRVPAGGAVEHEFVFVIGRPGNKETAHVEMRR